MDSPVPVVKHLVLIGGGHSHLAVLRGLGMRPVPGLAVTLISRDVVTPYSGSLPGHLSGAFGRDEIHIDLRPLTRFASARLIQEEVGGLDLARRRVILKTRPDLPFDLLSLNIGSLPDARRIPGATEHAVGVKPIDAFLKRWEAIRAAAVERLRSGREHRLAIVGGGPAGVELAFAARRRIHRDAGLRPLKASGFKIVLICADEDILTGHNAKARAFVRTQLARRGVEVMTASRATAFEAGAVALEGGAAVPADAIVFATGASVPSWPFDCGLERSPDGFILVERTLQCAGRDFVFAAGDAATVRGEPRPKSGVYAVRQGRVLAENLRRFATGRRLKTYFPQRRALALMSMGGGRAVASRGGLFFAGRAAGALKSRIDAAFVRKHRNLPDMKPALGLAPGLVDGRTERALRRHAMRCAGCGAKVAGGVLREVLDGLPDQRRDDVLAAAGGIEDASQVLLDDGRVLLQSVDHLRAFIDDPWLFARIAANHCLGDIHAMGASAHSALAVVGLPFAARRYARHQLEELMQGCALALGEEGCALIGGHTAESAELQFGLCVNAFADRDRLLAKEGMGEGEILVLTKALGTGVLLAADMRRRAAHAWMAPALEQMTRSSREAARLLAAHGATACTDVTGFGLAGHLLEMLGGGAGGHVRVRLALGRIPALDGALECLGRGIASSLHQDNSAAGEAVENAGAFRRDPRLELLFDPQTAGGLLASVPADRAEACVAALRRAGCSRAAAIGRVLATGADAPAIVLE